MARFEIKTGCYDLVRVAKFLRSVALAIAIQRNSQMKWVAYRDSMVLNAIYTVLFWKEQPGTFEVEQNRQVIEADADILFEEYLNRWFEILHEQGPAAVNAWVGELGIARQHAMQATESMLRDAASVNLQVADELRDGIVALSRIKLAATVGVAVVGAVGGIAALLVSAGSTGGLAAAATAHAGAGSGMFAATNFGYSVTTSVISTWEDMPKATIAGIGYESFKAGLGQASDAMSESLIERTILSGARAQQIIRSAEGVLAKFQEKLLIKGLQRASRRKAHSMIQQSTGQIAAQGALKAESEMLKTAGTALGSTASVIFAAWDIIDGIRDYNETMEAISH